MGFNKIEIQRGEFPQWNPGPDAAVLFPRKCNGDNGLYVSSYYFTAATCQISEHEKLALEFEERSFHVFDSIDRPMFKYTFVSSRVPRQLHS